MINKIKQQLGLSTPLHPDPSDRERQEILGFAMKYVHYLGIEGDYFEFGVFEGKNLCRALYYSKSAALDQLQFHAFDSFQGLPEFEEKDGGFNPFKPKEYSATRPFFEATLKECEFPVDRLSIHEGWYDEKLPALKSSGFNTKASIIWIDCDLYSSTLSALEFMTGLIADGAIVLFDDWYCFKGDPKRGEQGAFEYWLEQNPRYEAVPYRKFGWHGNSFILRIV